MAEETGAYEVFPRSVHSFSGLCIFGVIHAVDVVHGPLYSFCRILSVKTGNKRFYAPSGGADEHQRRAQIGVIKQLLP